MTSKVLVLAVCLAAGAPGGALARPDPAPPPSGVVVHLFGQDSALSTMPPTAPSGLAQSAAAPPAYVEPTTSQILHQMFVTGDPNAPSKPSAGRTTQRLAD